MKLSLLVPLAALLVPQLSAGQIPGIQTSEVVQTGTAWEEVVKNVSGSPIVTLHATFHCLTTNGLRITDENGSHDSLYQFSRDRDIPQGDSVVVRVSDNNYAQCSGGVDAVIFSDGHSEGRSEEIANIYVHRRGLQKGLEFAIPLLDAIATGQLTTQDAIAALDKRGSSVAIDMTRSGKDRGGETIVYDFVLSNLRRQSDFSTQPTFVEAASHESRTLRKQRIFRWSRPLPLCYRTDTRNGSLHWKDTPSLMRPTRNLAMVSAIQKGFENQRRSEIAFSTTEPQSLSPPRQVSSHPQTPCRL